MSYWTTIELSPRAWKMLSQRRRHKIETDPQHIKDRLAKDHVEPVSLFVEFERQLGGYEIRDKSFIWRLGIQSASEKRNGVHFVEFASMEIASPCSVLLNEHGKVYVEYRNSDEIIICDSINVFVEYLCMYDYLRQVDSEDSEWIGLYCDNVFGEMIGDVFDLTQIPEACDNYVQWWTNEDQTLFVNVYQPWEQPPRTARLEAYSLQPENLDPIKAELKKTKTNFRLDPYGLGIFGRD